MANIQTFLDKIKSAIYGEEVRGSIVSAIEAMNEESSSAEQNTSTIVSKINASTASATGTDQGTSPTASFVDKGTKFEFVFTIPKGDTGPQGPKGDIGPKGDTPPLSNIAPSSLGTASSGTGTNASREDHVHPMPTADDIRYDTNASVKQVVGSLEEAMDDFKDAIVTEHGSETEDTRISYEESADEVEVPTIEELNDVDTKVDQLKDDVADIAPDDTVVNGKPWTSKKTVDELCQPFEVTGTPVQCYPVEGYPLGVKVSWEPTQEGSGDPSPDNIRPITGRDSVSITRCGRNLVRHKNGPGYTITWNGLTVVVNDDYSVTVTGTATQLSTYAFYSIKDIYVVPYYTDAMDKTVSRNGFVLRDICAEPYAGEGTRVYLCFYANQTIDKTYYPVLAYGNDDTYDAYTGSTNDIALPETVYGGTLDAETGVLTVDRATVNLDGDNIKFSVSSGGTYWETNRGSFPNIKYIDPYSGKYIVSHLGKVFYSNTSYGFIFCGIESFESYFATVDDFNAYLASQYATRTPVQICYELETPYTIQLTPQQIAALSGVNTLYTDAGTLTVTGREDPRHTITELRNAIISLGGNV